MPKDMPPDEAFEGEGTSLEAMYSPEYLADCAGPEARAERLLELKRRIEARAYLVDPERIAEELILRGDLKRP